MCDLHGSMRLLYRPVSKSPEKQKLRKGKSPQGKSIAKNGANLTAGAFHLIAHAIYHERGKRGLQGRLRGITDIFLLWKCNQIYRLGMD